MSEITTPTDWQSDPASTLAQRCTALAEGLSPNLALSNEVCWCVREKGDWLAAVIAPGFVRVILLPGGGDLWGHIPLGQQRYVALGGVDWRFFAAHDPVLGDYQYVDLVDSMAAVSDNAAARHLAADARVALGLIIPVPAASEEPPRQVSRRGFLRAFTGRR